MSDKCLDHPTAQTYQKPQGPHMGLYCMECDRWLRWVPKENLEDFVWPIGSTFKGATIGHMVQTQRGRDYLIWASENLSVRNLKLKAKEALNLFPMDANDVPKTRQGTQPRYHQEELDLGAKPDDDDVPWRE